MRSIAILLLSALLVRSTRAETNYLSCYGLQAGHIGWIPSGFWDKPAITLSSRLGKVEGRWDGMCYQMAIIPKSWAVYSRNSGAGIIDAECIDCCDLNCGFCAMAESYPAPKNGDTAEANRTRVEAIERFMLYNTEFGCTTCEAGFDRVVASQQEVTKKVAAGVVAGQPEKIEKYMVNVYKCVAKPTPTKPPVDNTGNEDDPEDTPLIPKPPITGEDDPDDTPLTPGGTGGGVTGEDDPDDTYINPPTPNGGGTSPKPGVITGEDDPDDTYITPPVNGGNTTTGGTEDDPDDAYVEPEYPFGNPVNVTAFAAAFSVKTMFGDFAENPDGYYASISKLVNTPKENIKATPATPGMTISQEYLTEIGKLLAESNEVSTKGAPIDQVATTKQGGRLLKAVTANNKTDTVEIITAVISDTPEQVLLKMSKSAKDGTLDKALKEEGYTPVPVVDTYQSFGVVKVPKNATKPTPTPGGENTDVTPPKSAASFTNSSMMTLLSMTIVLMFLV